MHDQRIAALEDRLVILDAKEGDGRISAEVAARDRAATTAELVALRGIRARNQALVVEAPQMTAKSAALAKRRHDLREKIQLTPGSTIPAEE